MIGKEMWCEEGNGLIETSNIQSLFVCLFIYKQGKVSKQKFLQGQDLKVISNMKVPGSYKQMEWVWKEPVEQKGLRLVPWGDANQWEVGLFPGSFHIIPHQLIKSVIINASKEGYVQGPERRENW